MQSILVGRRYADVRSHVAALMGAVMFFGLRVAEVPV
jgi:hypothetical protein